MNGDMGAKKPQSLPTSEKQENPEIQVLQKETDWFIGVDEVTGTRRYYRKEELSATLRASILEGKHQKSSSVAIHSKTKEDQWDETSSTVFEFAKSHFALRVLYQPVWGHAMAGLKWGALVGIALKLLDTLILLESADTASAMMFLFAIGACLIPRIGIYVAIGVSIVSARITNVNVFIIGLSAALTGAILGCLPGMAIGGIIGMCRKSSLLHAYDAAPEPEGMFVKAVLLPLIGGCGLFGFYIFVFNPWLVTVLE